MMHWHVFWSRHKLKATERGVSVLPSSEKSAGHLKQRYTGSHAGAGSRALPKMKENITKREGKEVSSARAVAPDMS